MRATATSLMGLAALLLAAPASSQSAEDVGKSAERIVTKPLKDVNIIKEDIPETLQAASKAPYSLDGVRSCQQFAAEIAKLDKVLGPDVDKVKPKSGESVGEIALGGIESVASSLIPGSGLIRKVSGAEAREKEAKAAVYSGGLRRAYLKGTARAKGCKV